MKVEELFALLKEKGVEDNDVKALLAEALKTLETPDEKEAKEKEMASNLLGVNV